MRKKTARRRARVQSPKSAQTSDALEARSLWVWISIALVISFVALIRIRLIDLPLERDEGEFAYVAQLMLQGVPPYALAYNMKLPGTYGAYAVVLALFGQTPAAVHWGLLLVNVLTIVLVYLLGNRLFGRLAGVVASASYGLLAVCPSVQGLAAHSTHFVLLPALGGLLVLTDRHRTRQDMEPLLERCPDWSRIRHEATGPRLRRLRGSVLVVEQLAPSCRHEA